MTWSSELVDSMLHVRGLLDDKDRVFLREQAARAQQLFGAPTIVNIGVANGASCYCLRVGSPKATLIGVDPLGWPSVDGTPEMLAALNMQLLAGRSQDMYEEIPDKIHLIFIDGDHAYTVVRKDIELWVLPHVVPNGVVAFHDAKFEDGHPFHHVGIQISKAIDLHLGPGWEEQPIVFQTRWFRRLEL